MVVEGGHPSLKCMQYACQKEDNENLRVDRYNRKGRQRTVLSETEKLEGNARKLLMSLQCQQIQGKIPSYLCKRQLVVNLIVPWEKDENIYLRSSSSPLVTNGFLPINPWPA